MENGEYKLRDGSIVTDRRLDRLVQFDERSRNFPIRAMLETVQKKWRSYTWRVGKWLNQGAEGACVGYAWTHELSGRPVKVPGLTDAFARDVYRRAQKIDEWPGEAYEGTSVLAGAKICQDPYFDEYRWAFGLDDLRLTLGYKGPAVLGINWYQGMFDTDSDGYIHPTGNLAGGHAILACANSERYKRFTLHNSWGAAWGRDGEAFISYDDMDRLLHEQGEACIPVLRRMGNQ